MMLKTPCVVLVLVLMAVIYTSRCSGQYCSTRDPTCCPGRDDDCYEPYKGTKCYCDMFCNHTAIDCCPDFWGTCGFEPPTFLHCFHEGLGYPIGSVLNKNCNKCVCRASIDGVYAFSCENKACAIRPELIEDINGGSYGWRASNYSSFWGLKLSDATKYRLGTLKVERAVAQMTEIDMDMKEYIPREFDSRKEWGYLQDHVMDQGNCGSSWAFSTVGVATDRLAIQSKGNMQMMLSPQHLLSCNTRRQRGCEGGYLDRAWWFMRKRGVVSDQCYPYTSGSHDKKGTCMMPGKYPSDCPKGKGHNNDLYHCTPPYRIAANEKEIQLEIKENGPVQASFEVKEDFFMYKSGVYRHTRLASRDDPQYKVSEWHSVKILGWGTERGVKYWLCANSWGNQWGEDGYFKILRGENECNIESFVVGVWGKVDSVRKPTQLSANDLRYSRRQKRSTFSIIDWMFS